jgi:hypothetical protein
MLHSTAPIVPNRSSKYIIRLPVYNKIFVHVNVVFTQTVCGILCASLSKMKATRVSSTRYHAECEDERFEQITNLSSLILVNASASYCCWMLL